MSDAGGGQGGQRALPETGIKKWRRRSVRYGPPTTFPIIAAVTANIAGVNHGAVRVYWTLGAIAATAGTAIFSGLKERQAALSTSAAVAAVEAKTQLGSALARAGEPLVTALGNLTAAKTAADRKAKVEVLTRLTVDVAAARCGRDVDMANRGSIRSVFYELSQDGVELARSCFAGRQGNKKPRPLFKENDSSHDDLAFMIVRSDEVLLVEDLEHDPPKEFRESKTRTYKSLIAVGVRAGNESFGLLAIDSDKAFSLTDVDRGYLVLLAGILAAGLAYVAGVDSSTAAATIPQQSVNAVRGPSAKQANAQDAGGP